MLSLEISTRLNNLFILTLGIFALFGVFADPAQAVSIEVKEDNANAVADRSQPNKVGFEIDWNNTRPVLLQVHFKPDDTGSTILFGGTIRNNSSRTWKGFHVELGDNTTWKDDSKLEANTVSAWDGRQLSLSQDSNDRKINMLESSRITTRTKDVICFHSDLPSPGRLVLGSVEHFERLQNLESADWIINIKNLKTRNHFTIRLWPILNGCGTAS